jgi:hypothetical protein
VAGYSGTPLPKKLGIKEGARVALVGAPDGFERALAPLPDGVALSRRVGRPLDVIVFFSARRAELERRFQKLAQTLGPAGGLRVAWPKKSSRLPTDLDQTAVMEVGLATSLVDNKVCALDDTWSGLRFVVRREHRAAWPTARS